MPLPGHTLGHCGVALRTGERWLLHCGDAVSPVVRQTDPSEPLDAQPSWLLRRLVGNHVPRLRELLRSHSSEIDLISAHDMRGFLRHQRRTQARRSNE